MWVLLVVIGCLLIAQSCMRFRISDADAQREFRKAGLNLKTATLHTGNVPLHYVQTGSDTLPTLLFIHGSPGSWTAFKPYLKDTALLKKYRLVALDRPGFGYSHFGRAYPLQEQASAISPLLTVLQNGHPLYLVGYSFAGALVVALAAQHPNAITGIVTVAGAISTAHERPEKWRWLFFYTPLGLLLPGALRTSNDEIWYLKKDLKALVPQFKRVRGTVCLIHGTEDKLVPYNSLLWGSQAFTQASSVSSVTIPGASHFIPKEHYPELKYILLQLY